MTRNSWRDTPLHGWRLYVPYVVAIVAVLALYWWASKVLL